ncbi:signal transduction histidine kinase regulating citrate/malate metabolism [Streptomyces violaceusniger Tu 4113]|uniref:Signal transduction histidine kinase regulating citrate/malate metabolism n=1 Tax=Streptomyces violaceusniger (strain Tu 4113) TaxID=653045 RepID=G2PB81_STRV4|nr:signal transduction histidine kinase regulating citrate/malate metabolism [Streptomyces violaceusniger Tu 4113]
MAGRRFRSWLSVRSVAGQVFVLQLVIVLLLGAAATIALVLQVRHDATDEARGRSVAVAEAFANSPGIVQALHSRNPTKVLQPRAEAARKKSGLDFVVVVTPKGIRLTHPKPNRIGKHFIGAIGRPLRGHTITESRPGTLGPAMQAVAPIFDSHHRVVGLVGAGITIQKVSGLANRQLPLLVGAVSASLVLATGGTALVSRRLRRQTRGLDPVEMTRMYEHHDAVLHSVREGVLIVGGDGRLVLANDEARRLLDLPPRPEGRLVDDLGLEPHVADVLAAGRDVTDEVLVAGDRLLAINNRLTDRDGGPPGSVATLRDSTELRALSGRADVAQKRLKLLYDASVEIGTTLDVARTAEELAQVAVDRFADFVTVDLAEPVARGDEPLAVGGVEMRREAVHGIRPGQSHPFYPVGRVFSFVPTSPQAFGLSRGEPVVEADLTESPGWQAQDPERTAKIIEYGVRSLVTVPLRARGVLLGVVSFWRMKQREPFEEEEVSLAEELAAHAAVCIDNARRYTREHTMAVTLQHSLLPRALPEQNALDVAFRYLPAESGVGGDWFDVIPLPGARVALVVGDVVGHGLHAAATMGRLRTAVHNFSTLDLPPDEILSHLDDLIARIDQDEGPGGPDGDGGGGEGITGATCLYAIYDPVTRRCTMARAGHPPPALVRPDGSVEFLDLPAGPPLGLGGLPFETAEVQLAEGSNLVLYTDGLIEDRRREIDTGLEMLRDALSHPDRTPEEICTEVLDALLPSNPSDDIALIAARTRVVGGDRVASWDVPSDPAAVAGVRAEVMRKLAEWGLDEAAFTAELVLSELITNAIRHATGPIRVQLLRDKALICEVSDTSSTSPHLRYAATTDEGGRGLFLVAQFAERWGTRYTSDGKVIWAELAIP